MIAVQNALAKYYDLIRKAGELCSRETSRRASGMGFSPSLALCPLNDELEHFFAASTIRIHDMGEHEGVLLRLLDLTCNPRTRTTKTFAAHIMVARAVDHIRRTGESISLVTPTSANKGSALREAVSRALECQLVEAHQLRIAIVVPAQGLDKLWSLPLSEHQHLRCLNPVFAVDSEDGRAVKSLARAFVLEHSASLYERWGYRVWYTYDIDNYRMADAVRAFVEADYLECQKSAGKRVHAQAVSSAFGLIGHHLGWRVLTETLGRKQSPYAEWLLVQHLGTPDLVLNQLFGSFSRDNLPAYNMDAATGLLTQSAQRCFPMKTFAIDESIDSTFYSRGPVTAPTVAAIQAKYGGTGIVVSLKECLDRYGFLRKLLPDGDQRLPADPRDLREWALVMVMTGVLGAIERGLVAPGSEVIVHASGCYSVRDYVPIPRDFTRSASSTHDLLTAIVNHSEIRV